MKFELGSLWRTRNGNRARVICNDKKTFEARPIVVLAFNPGSEIETLYTIDESGCDSGTEHRGLDLIEPWVEPSPKLHAWICTNTSDIHYGAVQFVPWTRQLLYHWTRAEWLDEK